MERHRYNTGINRGSIMYDERSILQKSNNFIQAFLEFLGRPKTIFDLKDRARLLLILLLVIAVIEGVLYYVENLR